ncbi:MAG TPA: geranylgeranyl reductase family protein [Iamia sp.]
MTTPPPERCDVLVIGGGPAGSATAHWLAKAGRDVVVVEKKTFPREKTCGDGLTPRAVHQLEDMGLGPALEAYHRYDGLRAVAHGVTLELKWPEHPVFPSHGFVVRRRELDQLVASRAVDLGATLHTGTEALRPLQRDGLVVGAVVKDKGAGVEREIHARYVVVADGANSRFGRALGTARNRTYPMGIAIRTYYESPLHDEPWIESALDVRDRQGRSLPGYGWIFPVGDGTINVGIGLLSTFKGYREVNTSHLMEEFANTLPSYWGIAPDSPTCAPTGGRIPMAQSINPKIGPTWVAVGDAAGSVNPFNGEGIDYAYETGRMVAELLDEAIGSGDGMALQRYPALIAEEYGLYFRVARLFSVVIGNPAVMRELTRVGMQSRSLMDWVLRIMANLLRPDEIGPAEAAYKAVAAIVRTIPDPTP